MIELSAYERQVLLAIEAGRSPCSSLEYRRWATPPRNVRRYAALAVDGLLKLGLVVNDGRYWFLKPSAAGLEVITKEKLARWQRKARPVLFASIEAAI